MVMMERHRPPLGKFGLFIVLVGRSVNRGSACRGAKRARLVAVDTFAPSCHVAAPCPNRIGTQGGKSHDPDSLANHPRPAAVGPGGWGVAGRGETSSRTGPEEILPSPEQHPVSQAAVQEPL